MILPLMRKANKIHVTKLTPPCAILTATCKQKTHTWQIHQNRKASKSVTHNSIFNLLPTVLLKITKLFGSVVVKQLNIIWNTAQ